jgi:hypothetical protein
MKFDVDELHYRIRTDHRFKKRLRTLVIIGGAVAVMTVVIAVIGVVFFSSAMIGFAFSSAPALYEIVFSTARGFASSFMLDDLTAALNPLAGEANVREMKNLITQYFDQLSGNPAIEYQNFQKFFTTVKNSLSDGQISSAELESVKQFILKK